VTLPHTVLAAVPVGRTAGGDLLLSFAPYFPAVLLVALVCGIAAFLAVKLGNARKGARSVSAALSEERDHARRVEGVVSRFGSVMEALGTERTLAWVAETARDSLGAPYAHAALLGGPHRTSAGGGEVAYPSWWHPTVQGLVLRCCREGEVVRSEEAIHGMVGFVAVPLVSPRGESLGALVVGGKKRAASEERVLGSLARVAASVLETAEDAPAGRDPVSNLPNAASLYRVLDQCVSRGDAFTVLVVDVDRFREYNRAHGYAAGDALLRRIGERLGEHRGRVFRLGEDEFALAVAGTNRTRATRIARGLRQELTRLTAADAAIPLTASVGFAVTDPRRDEPETVMAAAARALARAKKLPEGVSGDGEPWAAGGHQGDAEVAAVVSALAAAAGAREPRLGEHLRAVSELARLLATRMALPRQQTEALVVGALLHDVGKIATPDSVLRKPGPLTAAEYEIVRQHPAQGERILKSAGNLASALAAVRHHHERFDGRGYPDGLRGEEIPLAARIVIVADAFDSMVRDRPYRRGVREGEALEEIKRRSGTQFDPEVVEALEGLLAESDRPRREDIAE